MIRCISLFSLCIAVLGCSFAAAHAQEALLQQTSTMLVSKPSAPYTGKSFVVTVRAIEAEGSLPLSENMQSTPERDVELDPRVEDLRQKLARLPFSTFRLVSSEEENVTLMGRRKIHLANGQSLCVRPVERNGETITMWLKWKDTDGMSILDTRLNFALNESMVAGVEGQENTGVILAVRVSPDIDS